MLSDLKRLTTKQRKFCDYYIQNGNATKSAIQAGYSKRSARQIGNRLLSKDYISEYVQSELKKIDANSIANVQELLKFYTDVERGNVTEPVVEATPTGVYTGTKKPSIKDRISASNELMKRYAPIHKAKMIDAKAKAYMNKAKADAIKSEDADKHVRKPVPLVKYLKKIANSTENGRNANRSAKY